MSNAANPVQLENNKTVPETLYLVDGSGFIFRAYHALPPLNRPDGTPVNAVLGFTNMLVKLLVDLHAPACAVIFDAARKNFRNDIYPAYKANRGETPEDLIPQFPLIRESVEAFNLPCLEVEGYEADDLIATYARLAVEAGCKKVVIVSSDKDLMQLVTDKVSMLDAMKGKEIGIAEVLEKFGVPPEKVIDVQALTGDSIDNVPGVPGIGIKTAAQLIEEYGDLDNLLAHANEIKQNKRRETLIEHADNARLSRQLVRLDDNAPVPMAVTDLLFHPPEAEKIADWLQQQGFRSTWARVSTLLNIHENNKNNGNSYATVPVENKTQDYSIINDEKTLQDWMAQAVERGILAIDTETTSLTPAKAELVGISISTAPNKAAYIPIGHKSEKSDPSQGFDFGDDAQKNDNKETIPQLSMATVIKYLKPVLEDPSVLKIGHNFKYDWQMLAQHGVETTAIDDTMLLSYVLDGSRHSHGMDALAELFCNHKTTSFKDVAGSGKDQLRFDEIAIDKAAHYAAEDADITLRLHQIFKPRLVQEKMATLYETIERPLIPLIAKMEQTGIKVDPNILRAMSHEFQKKLAHLEETIFQQAGTNFNVASPKQLGEVLFDQMGLKGGKKSKTGVWSTAVDVLEPLALQGHKIVEDILEWRQVAKLKSTYTDALQEQINPKTGRVHTSFAMAITNTGRLSSTDPNLQNIPIRTEDGRRIRAAFVADEGYRLLCVDYSQIELRLLAELAGVKTLRKAFLDGLDIHAHTASQVFGVPMAEMTSETRRKAKAINFGIIYGISGFGLAKQLGCEPGEAKRYIDEYLKNLPELSVYMDQCKDFARKHGYVQTLYGRKCYVDGIHDKNPARRQFAERQSINAPLQGTAADIMKRAMINVDAALKNSDIDIKILLQVHDELVFEVAEKDIERARILIKNTMESVIDLSVPLIAEAGIGKNWAEAH